MSKEMKETESVNQIRLFVGGMNYVSDEQALVELFDCQAINVIEAVVIRDRENGNRSKGFGFVTIATSKSVESVIEEYNGAECEGRHVTVGEARPKTPRENVGRRTGKRISNGTISNAAGNGDRGKYTARHSKARR